MTNTKALAQAVRKVASGYLLMHLHFKIDGFDLLEDWLGWILLWLAIQDLKTARPKAALLERFCIVLGVWAVIEWQAFFPLPDWLGPVTLVLRLIRIYFDFQLLTELAHLAGAIPDGGGEELTKQILGARTAIVVLQTATTLSGMVPVSFFGIGLLEYLWSGGMFFLVLLQLAFILFLMYLLFELAKVLEKADQIQLEK